MTKVSVWFSYLPIGMENTVYTKAAKLIAYASKQILIFNSI